MTREFQYRDGILKNSLIIGIWKAFFQRLVREFAAIAPTTPAARGQLGHQRFDLPG